MFQNQNDLSSLKIVDFGLSQDRKVKNYSYPKCGTPGYVAPEIANL
jgi:calcium-dependent protein kinase